MSARPPARLPVLKNVGPVSARWLADVGVRKRADLIRLGAVQAFLKVKAAGHRPSLNLLWALAGAERGLHWTRLPADARQRLLVELDAANSLQGPREPAIPRTASVASRRGPRRGAPSTK